MNKAIACGAHLFSERFHQGQRMKEMIMWVEDKMIEANACAQCGCCGNGVLFF